LIPALLAFLAGIWLVLAPFVLDYQHTGTGINGRVNDVVVGCGIVLAASVRMISPPTTTPWSIVNLLLGVWLVAAPFLLAYNERSDAVVATVNDMAVGAVVALLATVSWRLTRSARSPRKN
jgi:hypothetical protein